MIDFDKLSAPFPPEAIHWRVGATTQDKKSGLALAYLDARDIQKRLDEVCGPAGWQSQFHDCGNGRLACELRIRVDDEWVCKSDGAGATDVEGDKGAFSDSLKRSAVAWGIGRYLYDLDSPWVAIKQQGRSYVIANQNDPKLRRALDGVSQDEPSLDQAMPAQWPTATKLKEAAVALNTDIIASEDEMTLDGVLSSNEALVEAIKKNKPEWWFGTPNTDKHGISAQIANKRVEFMQKEGFVG